MNRNPLRTEKYGYCHIPELVTPSELAPIDESLSVMSQNCTGAGIRGLASLSPCIRALSESERLLSIVQSVLKSKPKLVRSVLFTKSLDANWAVGWHQDLSIATNRISDSPGFFNWTIKKGITHVQPPQSILEKMLTVRLHLDQTNETNGALKVVPFSHRKGRIPANEAASVVHSNLTVTCAAERGDILLIKPLILHSSSKSSEKLPRRIVHLEYSVAELPKGLAWNEAA